MLLSCVCLYICLNVYNPVLSRYDWTIRAICGLEASSCLCVIRKFLPWQVDRVVNKTHRRSPLPSAHCAVDRGVASVKKQYGDRTSTVASTVNLVRPKMARLITLSVQCMFVEQSWEYMYV